MMRNLLSGESPSGDLPDNEAKGVHVRCFERLKTRLVQSLIQNLKQVKWWFQAFNKQKM